MIMQSRYSFKCILIRLFKSKNYLKIHLLNNMEKVVNVKDSMPQVELQLRIQNYRPLVAPEIDNSLTVAPATEFWDAFKNSNAIGQRIFPIDVH